MEFGMKDAEDEAFDDIAKKQGHWGGGYQAKKAMAKARIEDDDDDTQVYQIQQLYTQGWNAALDEVAKRIGEMKGFGQATQDSFATYIKGLKK
jgi:hypothetical protein